MKNTKIEYQYRDGSNYKMHNECVVAGVVDEAGVDAIIASLDEGEYFIPRAVGMPETRFNEWTEDDHSYFELDRASFSQTDAEPTVDIDAETLIKQFKAAAGHWADFESDGPGTKPGPAETTDSKTNTAAPDDTVDEARAMQYLYEKFNLSGDTQRLCAGIIQHWNTHPETRATGVEAYLTSLLDAIGFNETDITALQAAGIINT